MYWLRWHYHVKDIAGAPYKIKKKERKEKQNKTTASARRISMAYFTTIVTLLFDENDIFISLESSIHALQDGCSISVGYKI